MFNCKGKNRTDVVNMGTRNSESLKILKEKWEGRIHKLRKWHSLAGVVKDFLLLRKRLNDTI